jgi:hypothetical protein
MERAAQTPTLRKPWSHPQGFLKVINMSLRRQRFYLPEAIFNAAFGLLHRRKGHRRFAMTPILDFQKTGAQEW